MSSAHLLYIPIVFSLGLLVGTLLSSSSEIVIKDINVNKNPRGVNAKLLGSFLIFFAVFIGTHFFNLPRSSKAVGIALNGAEIFDKKPSFSSEEVYSRIASFPTEGITLYKQFTYTIDILFPITLLAFLLLLSHYVTKRLLMPRQIRGIVLLVPIAWFASDMIENYIIYYLLNALPAKHEELSGMLGYLTITKFTLLLLSITIPTLLRVFEKTFIEKLNSMQVNN